MKPNPLLIMGLIAVIAGILWMVVHRFSPSPAEYQSAETAPAESVQPEHQAAGIDPDTGGLFETTAKESAGGALRIEKLTAVPLPSGPLASRYPALVEKALAGDKDAAYQLHRAMWVCHAIPVERREFDAHLLEVQTTHTYDGLYLGNRTPEILDRLRKWFDYCEDITADERAGYFDWLTLAAELGSLEAQLRFTEVIPPGDFDFKSDDEEEQNRIREFRQTAVRHLESAVQQGSVEAMEWLALAYYNGVMIEKHDVKAYTYALAAMQAHDQADSAGAPALHRFLEMIEPTLYPHQIEAARKEADRYLANPNCCRL